MALDKAKEEIFKVVPVSESNAQRTGDLITAAAGVNKTIGQQALEELYQENSLMRKMSTERGRPMYYWKPTQSAKELSFDPVAFRELVVTETNDQYQVFDFN